MGLRYTELITLKVGHVYRGNRSRSRSFSFFEKYFTDVLQNMAKLHSRISKSVGVSSTT